MSIRCAVLDFGNVVAFFDHRKACRQLAELSRTSGDAAQVYQAIFETPLETDYDTGRISTATFLQVLRDDLGVQASDAEIGRSWADIFTLNPSMGAVIGELHTRGLRLVLASNTNALHHEWFSRSFAATLSAFDAQVLSYQLGSRKPERPFFEACIVAAQCAPAECLYVDDRADFVAAGRALGLMGLVYAPGVDVLASTCY